MYVIDLSKGVTLSGLCRVVFSIGRQFLNILPDLIRECFSGDAELQQKAVVLFQKFMDVEAQNSVHEDDDTARTHLSTEQMIVFSGRTKPVIEKIIRASEIDDIGFGEFIIVLSILLVLAKIGEHDRVAVSMLRIGSNSPLRSLVLFEREHCMSDVHGMEIPVVLAALIAVCFRPFVGSAVHHYSRVIEMNDPDAPGLSIRVYECNTCSAAENEQVDEVAVIETNIDDSTSEIIANAMSDALSHGALDYTIVPVTMKKGRSAFQIQLLCRACDADRFARELLLVTSTFGVRTTIYQRLKLKRSMRTLETRFGNVSIKDGFLDGKLVKSVPEFDDVVRLSREHGLPVSALYNYFIGELNRTSL